MSVRRILSVVALAALSVPALAADPVKTGDYKAWSVYTATSPEGKVCYALSSPTATLPKKAARDKIYVIISVWPGRGVRDELQVVPGYQYRDGEPVWAQVGNAPKVEFFSRNDAKGGAAWVKEIADENALVSSMRSGSSLTVTGLSKRGTKTTDTYSLSGIAAALDAAHRACGK